MKSRTLLLCVLLSPTFCLPAQAADRAKVMELMKFNNVHEFIAGSIKMGIRSRQAEAGLTDAQVACVEAISPSLFIDVVAAAMADTLSDAEVSAAIDFYSSPTGQKVAAYISTRLAGKDVPNPYDSADVANIKEFRSTPGGERVFTQAAWKTDAVVNKMMEVTNDAIENCGKPAAR